MAYPSVWSTRFIGEALVDGDVATYTVPDGMVAILTDVESTVSGEDSGASVYATGEAGNWQLFYLYPPTADTSAQWTGRIVLQAGEELHVYQEGTTGSVTACGYLLTAPS